MADSQQNAFTTGVLQLANTFAVPFAQKLAGEKSGSASEFKLAEDMLAERIAWSKLNGSGPNNPSLANEAPQTTLDFILGRNLSEPQMAKRTGALFFVVLGLLAFVAWRVFSR